MSDLGIVAVAAFYRFIPIAQGDLPALRHTLEQFAASHGVRGLIVLGCEGINATVAAPHDVMPAFKAFIAETFPGSDISFKDSTAETMPFGRFKVDVRNEIITTKDVSLSAEASAGTHLTPTQWHQMMSSDPDVVVVDTRNDYETDIGVFKGALVPNVKKFSDFREWVEREGLPKDKKLLMYCTGGIRCEKAVPDMKRLGYEQVYQLEGGILRYLEEYPHGHFEGECFVFDNRIAVDAHLQPTKKYRLCPHCGGPSDSVSSCCECGKESTACGKCLTAPELHTCSKNCAYHARRKGAKAAGDRTRPPSER